MADERAETPSNLPDWRSGPPKSETESWNYERRKEVLQVAAYMISASVQAGEEWRGEDVVPHIVKQATRLVDEVDQAVPRL